jgi:hypothetical protein
MKEKIIEEIRTHIGNRGLTDTERLILNIAIEYRLQQDNQGGEEIPNRRGIAMKMWNALEMPDKYDLMGGFVDYVGRHPSSLTGREIEIMFFGKRNIPTPPPETEEQKGMSAEEWIKENKYAPDTIVWEPIPGQMMGVSLASVLNQFASHHTPKRDKIMSELELEIKIKTLFTDYYHYKDGEIFLTKEGINLNYLDNSPHIAKTRSGLVWRIDCLMELM